MKSVRQRRIFLALAFSIILLLDHLSLVHKSRTADEQTHLNYGTRILLGNSERIAGSQMPFSALNGIPRRIAYTRVPKLLGEELGGKLERFLKHWHTAKSMTIFFSLLLAFYVYRWSRELYGTLPAFFSLTLFVFEPNIIAHSRLVTADLFVTAMITIATYYFWRFTKSGGWRRGAKSAFALGLSQLAKYTSLFLYPIFALLLLVRYWTDLLAALRGRNLIRLKKYMKSFAQYGAMFIVVSILLINIGFLFNKPFVSLREYEFGSKFFRSIQASVGPLASFPVLVPYPYLHGLDRTKWEEERGENYGNIYLLGQLKVKQKDITGFEGYYFYAFLFKVPIAIQLFILFSIVNYVMKRDEFRFREDESFLLVPVLFFTIYFNFFFNTQIGIRFFLVAFPFLLIFCGSLLKNWDVMASVKKIGIVVLLMYLVASVLSYFPHYISYFNEFVWDRKQAYKILADSNLDWGGNHWYLEKYRGEHPEIVVNPDSPVPGRIVVEANYLLGVSVSPEKYRWLRENFEPVDVVGAYHLVYDVPPEALERILARVDPAPSF